MIRTIFLSLILSFLSQANFAQQKIENIVIVTTDGFRWQEVFEGMDSGIANVRKFNEGKGKELFKEFWDDDVQKRREKLLPFIWTTVSQNGQIYGNRNYENDVNVSNPYWFSYPGYSEIFCGYVDTFINSNSYKNNPNLNVLAFINQQYGYKNDVAAFASWHAFDRILNEEAYGFPVISGYDSCGGKHPNQKERLLNKMQADTKIPGGSSESMDLFTQYKAMQYLKREKPKVLYIAYGKTDTYAHEGRYFSYLNAAHSFDHWLSEIWKTIQNTPRYKNKTALFITVDHGRGDKIKSEWREHGSRVAGSDQIWFAVMAPGVRAKGEVKEKMQLYQKQFAQTIASLLGFTFTAEHPVGEKIEVLFEK